MIQAEQERLVDLQTEELPHDSQVRMSTRMNFNICENDLWRTAHSLLVDPSDTSEVEIIAKKYVRKRIMLFDHNSCLLTPPECFQAATKSRRNTIYLIPQKEVDISKDGESVLDDLMGLITGSVVQSVVGDVDDP
jgi:hypothetical protein